MRVIQAGEAYPDEISATLFLLGPDAANQASWRREALRHLETSNGEVFVPERRDPAAPLDLDALHAWQEEALRRSDHILVCLPDDADATVVDTSSLALVEAWGYWKGRDPARLILTASGSTELAERLRGDAHRHGIPVCDTLGDACRRVAAAGTARRQGGEVHVPLHVWRAASFQSWYKAQRDAGDALVGADVEWIFRSGKGDLLYWALHADLHVAAESRRKSNEVVLGRPDIAAVVLYRPAPDWLDTEVILVREFRSPARTPDGYHLGLPSGSSCSADKDALTVAREEVHEETGLDIPAARLRRHPDRQLLGTLSTHHAHLFAAELTPVEIAEVRARASSRNPHGLLAETERTYPCVRTVREIFDDPCVDWSTIGMIIAVVR
jgi:8-oxo-dGTP pyrophosphatase MutT (NUDIX family)